MAWTVSAIARYNQGTQRVVQLKIKADAAEANVDTGLAVIEHLSVGPGGHFGASSLPVIIENKDSSGTASSGKLGCSGFAANDEFYVIAYGR